MCLKHKNKYLNGLVGSNLYGILCLFVPVSCLVQKICNFLMFLGFASTH